jgi:hypothetical protein
MLARYQPHPRSAHEVGIAQMALAIIQFAAEALDVSVGLGH